jgi:hypothetical protein
MTNESAQLGDGLIAKDPDCPWEPSLLRPARLRQRSPAPGNYRKYRSIRIDNVTERTAAGALTPSGKPLKNNMALSVTDRIEALEWAAPRGLCGLFRVGA